MKQSSIEWLVEQYQNTLGESITKVMKDEINKAKELHKQEMIEFATEYDEYCHKSFVQNQYKSIKSAEQYYKNTYEKEN